jgi:preprotein translocase subunit SecG
MLDTLFSWDALWWLMTPVYVACCGALIVVMLLQKGKGVGFAGAFGVGPGSETLFGPRSAKSLPQRLTYGAAATFMILALVMSMLSGKVGRGAAPDLVDETVEVGQPLNALFGDGEEATETVTTPLVVDASAVDAPAAEETAIDAGAAEEAAPAGAETAPAESTDPQEAAE